MKHFLLMLCLVVLPVRASIDVYQFDSQGLVDTKTA